MAKVKRVNKDTDTSKEVIDDTEKVEEAEETARLEAEETTKADAELAAKIAEEETAKAEAARVAEEKATAIKLAEEKEAEAEKQRLLDAESETKKALNWDGVKNVLIKQDISFEDKMTILKDTGSVSVKSIVSKLESYRETMSPKTVEVKASVGAAKNFDLLATIKSVTNEGDYQVFKAKFDLVNAYFKEYSKDAYSEWLLHRFDVNWVWGKEALTAYQFLVTTITMLCDKVTRADELKKINLDSVLNKEATKLSDVSIENIQKYYRS